MRNKQILLSGRAVTTNAANVPADRYSFLHLSDAEPNLGTASANGWVLVYDTSTPGNRLWSKNLITAYDHANSAYGSQNTTGSYANAAFLKANSAYESQNVTGTYANNAYIHANAANLQANSAYESQNVTGTYANNAYLHANSAYESQNTTGVYANAAFLKANAAYASQNVTGTYANNAYLHANSAYESQNTTGVYANAAFLKANSAYESQNVTGTYANNAYLHANSAYESQNVTGTYANAAYAQANSASLYANGAFVEANAAYNSQNTTGVYANAAYAQANSASLYANGAFVEANAAFLKANAAYESQNTTGVYANAAFLKANSAYESQNVTGTYANSAYVRANNSLNANVGGLVTGNVVIQGDLSVTGNTFILGNTFSIDAGTLVANDTLLLLGQGNFTNDLLDIGISSHYNDGTNAHTGLIRDAGTKEWHLFKDYVPEISGNNNININHPTFIIDTLNANLHSEYVRVRGIEIGYYANSSFAQANAAYASQNVTGTYANAAYAQANSASLYANGAFIEANSAYDSQNTTGVYANAAYAQANSASLYANGAFAQANAAYESQNVTGTYANNAYTHANAAFLKANSAYESQNVTGTYANNAYLHANAAFIHANSAYESQNTTGVYANAAFTHANSAYNSQNTTGVYANSAFLKANSAYESQNVTGTYANNAYLHANSAFAEQNLTYAYANAGFLKTNSAYQHANSAYDSQNTTGVYANAAFTKANAAVFSITPNTSEIWVNTSTSNIQIGLANVNANIGTYGGTEAIPVITTDGHGRILSVSNTTISVPPGTYIFPNTNQLTSNASSGNVLIGLANVNNNIGTWGGNEAIPVINVDGYGRILSVSNTTISVPPGTYIFPNTGQLTANASSGNIKIGLAEVALNVGIYGSSISIPTMNIDVYGRVVSVTNSSISIPEGTYITNSNLIIANSSTGNVVLGLAPSGVTPGTYGGTGQTPVLTVDQYGRVTVAANVASAVNALSTIIRNSYTATAAQTVFNTTSSFTPGYADVYVNGVKLSPADYVANPVGSIQILNPTLLNGDAVDIQTATTFIVDANTKYEKTTFTASSGQTTFSAGYTPGSVNVYLNGLRLKETDDFVATNGSSVTLTVACDANDVVEIEKTGMMYTYLDNVYLATRYANTATSNGQTTFTVTGGYKIGFVDVYLNGIKLNIPVDVIATDGSTIVMQSSIVEVGDIIEVIGIGPEFTPANAIPITGGTIYGNLNVWNNVSVNNSITTNTITATGRATIGSMNVTVANISSNLQVSYNVTANAVNVATVYFNDGTFMSTAASGRGDGITWKIASANVTANLGEGLLVDTTSANVYVTLNASPYTGNTTRILDMTGNFAINNCIVKGNGQKIMGSTDDLVISSNNAGIGLVYSNATHGWRIIENP